jgi:hypothetical protein
LVSRDKESRSQRRQGWRTRARAARNAAGVARSHGEDHFEVEEEDMATAKQKAAARKNIKKAAKAARSKKTISHLSKATRTALGKQGAKVAKQKRSRGK